MSAREQAMRRHPSWRRKVDDVQDLQAVDLANREVTALAWSEDTHWESDRSAWDDLRYGLKIASVIAAAALIVTIFILYATSGVTT